MLDKRLKKEFGGGGGLNGLLTSAFEGDAAGLELV